MKDTALPAVQVRVDREVPITARRPSLGRFNDCDSFHPWDAFGLRLG